MSSSDGDVDLDDEEESEANYSDVGEDGLDYGEADEPDEVDESESEEDRVEEFRPYKPQTPRYWSVAPAVKGRHALAKLGAVCFLCGDSSHIATNCPDQICQSCLGRGHRNRDCPSVTSGRITVCSICARVGHERSECPERDRPPADVSKCRCVACGKLGHVDCSAVEQRPRHVSCMNCGGMGHAAIDCVEDGNDRWQRLFAIALGSGGGGSGRNRSGNAGSNQRGHAPSGWRKEWSRNDQNGVHNVQIHGRKGGGGSGRGGGGGGRKGGRGGREGRGGRGSSLRVVEIMPGGKRQPGGGKIGKTIDKKRAGANGARHKRW